MMKNKLTLRILTTLLLLSWTSAYAEPFKVGVILPLSGPAAMYGKASINGTDIFKIEMPGHNLQLVFDDSKFEGATSISAYHKLIANDQVDMIYVWGAGPAAAIAPITEFKKIPAILMTGDTKDVVDRKYSISFMNQLRDFSLSLLGELRKRSKKKFAIVKTEIQFLETIISEMKNSLKPDESLNIIESFTPGQNANFQATITKLKIGQRNGIYDSLGIMLPTGQLSSFYKKIYEQKLDIDTFTTHFLESKDEKSQAGASIERSFYAALNATATFTKQYEEKFGTTDQVGFAAQFYDFLTLVNDLFGEDYRNNKKLTPEEILSRIESVKERDGVSGKYYFTKDNPEGDPVGGKRFKFPIVIKEVTEGGGERVIR